VDWETWKPIYTDIAFRLDLTITDDYAATKTLSHLIKDVSPIPLLERLGRTIRERDVVIFGCGPSLMDHIAYVSQHFSGAVHIAADGAISALREYGLGCDILVTDLDGNMEDILFAVAEGTLPVVHAHGDNQSAVLKSVPQMDCLLGSTQVEPLPNVFLWGGFTDGDRACYLASEYGPRRIVLAGMDFGSVVGKWSKPGHTQHFPASPRKMIKLQIAEDLLNRLWMKTGIDHISIQEMMAK
jgi:uncharacterized Rossmann fold enzyme